MHAIWWCPVAYDVWVEEGSPVQKWRVGVKDVFQLWDEMHSKLTTENVEKVVMMLRNIWHHRNKVIFDKQFLGPTTVVQMSLVGYEDFKVAQRRLGGEVEQKNDRVGSGGGKGWKKREGLQLKANFDAALNVSSLSMGIGIVIRDCNGEVFAVKCAKRTCNCHAVVAECTALWEAMVLCEDLGLGVVMFEWDAKAVIDALIVEIRVPDQSQRNTTFSNDENRSIPRALHNYSKLEILDISQNYFYGAILDDIHCMSQLRELYLDSNNFVGNIPSSIGSFPLEIGNLSNLVKLGLAYNSKIVPLLPSEFRKLKKLKFLWMTGTNLMGQIPNTIDEMAALEHLDLSKNSLICKIPNSLFMPKNLRFVYLYKNQLSGEIPQVVEALNLNVIDLSKNYLTRPIPDDFGKLKNLTSLALFLNPLFGKISDSIGHLPKLINLNLFNNNFSGSLPSKLGEMATLEHLDLSKNSLTSKIPDNLFMPKNLRIIYLCKNKLFMPKNPPVVEALDLDVINISKNYLIGTILDDFGKLNNLTGLALFLNQLFGKIPDSIGHLPRLINLNLFDNNFSGSLPPKLGRYSMLEVLQVSNNKVTSQLP
ncbi:receptor-like protein 52 [Carya illinoinensis]|uniref:receptor-like protein 52 n=1 Tax=Carya illinoinensis TaxID=32201 RepID=UPI001C721D7C|nr:receptor-like protein 52 [Carya illinoinensis]